MRLSFCSRAMRLRGCAVRRSIRHISRNFPEFGVSRTSMWLPLLRLLTRTTISDIGTKSLSWPLKAVALSQHRDREPLSTGEFILGYVDETGLLPDLPQPEILTRN